MFSTLPICWGMLFTQNSPGVRLLLGELNSSYQPANRLDDNSTDAQAGVCQSRGFASVENTAEVHSPPMVSFPHWSAKSGQVSANPTLLSLIPGSFARRAFICQRKQVQSCRTWAEHLTLVAVPALSRFILASGSATSTPPQLIPAPKSRVWMVRFGLGSAVTRGTSIGMSRQVVVWGGLSVITNHPQAHLHSARASCCRTETRFVCVCIYIFIDLVQGS